MCDAPSDMLGWLCGLPFVASPVSYIIKIYWLFDRYTVLIKAFICKLLGNYKDYQLWEKVLSIAMFNPFCTSECAIAEQDPVIVITIKDLSNRTALYKPYSVAFAGEWDQNQVGR